MCQVGLTAQAAESTSPRLEEIIVVAQRRAENIQDVPISINAIQSEDLTNFNIGSAIDVQKLDSSFHVNESAGSVNLFIRGLGNPATAQGNEGSVAAYIDGVYYPRLSPELLKLNSIERIEVLKGPQGTLFGRNSTAGLIHIITRDPTQETTVKTEIGYGNYNAVEGSLYASTGLTENLASDIAIRYEEQFDGWGETVELPTSHPGYVPNPRAGQDFGEGWTSSVRSKTIYEPTDSTKLTLTADYIKGKDNRSLFGTYMSGTHGPILPPQTFIYPRSDRYDSIGDGEDSASSEGWGVVLQWEQAFSFADFISITNYHELEGSYRADADRSPLPLFNFDGVFENENWSQEFRLQSNGDGPLSWTGGLYYMYFDTAYVPSYFRGGLWEFLGQAFFGVPNAQAELHAHQEVDSYSAFFQATYEILPGTNLTLGGRYTIDDVSGDGENVFVDTVNGARVIDTFFLGQPPVDDNEEFEKFTYRVALDHRLTDDVLLYASVSRGYKAGVYNLLPISTPVVKPEVLDAFEIGAKTEWLDNRVRLNLAAFYWEATDLQVARFNGVGIVILNAAEATSQGIEADLQASVTEALDVHASVTYTDAEYDSFPGAPFIGPNPNPPGGNLPAVGIDAAGNHPPNAPKVSFNVGFSYRVPSEMGEFLLSSNYAYQTKSYFQADNLTENPSHGVLDATLKFSPAGYPGLSFTLWGRNLTDDEFLLMETQIADPSGSVLGPNAPRTYGFKVGYDF